jgi:hypothetical protein
VPVLLEGCVSPALLETLTIDSIIKRLFNRPGNRTGAVYRPRLRKEVLAALRGPRNATFLDLHEIKRLTQRTRTSTEDQGVSPSWTHLDTPNSDKLDLEQVLRRRREGGMRVFVRLSSLATDLSCYWAFRQPDGTLAPGHQTCLLLDGLWKPPPIPSDLYGPTHYSNDLAWHILSAAGTGSQLHQDPDLMGAWNLLMVGRKWWALHPSPLPPGSMDCDTACSPGSEDTSYSLPWFAHMLPQLKSEEFLGSSAVEFVQKAGEVLYLPHGMHHAIHNLEDTAAVTENYLFMDALPSLVRAVAEDVVRPWVLWPEARGLHTLYMLHADRETRAKMRDVYRRVQDMAFRFPNQC